MAPLDDTIRFLDLKNIISRCQNRHSKCLSSKVMVKDVFLHNVANITRVCMSHLQTAHDIFNLMKGPDPSYLVKFGNILPVNN